MNPHQLLLATDAINAVRQWLYNPNDPNNSVAHRMPTDEGTERMLRLELDLLRIEEMVGAVADGERPEFGLLNEVRGLLVLAVRP